MFRLKFHIIKGLFILLLISVMSCKQEDMLFYPEKLSPDYVFTFNRPFKELFFDVDEKTKINGLLFQADSSKGLIFYLHGNAGSLRTWGDIADVYLDNNFDFFIMDYRGFGKSEGQITSEAEMFNDIQIVYDSLKKTYPENQIVVIGYSIGTGPSAWLASENNPRMLILKAPYYNLPNLVHQHYKIIPSFLIRYKFRTNEYLPNVECPVIIFHGDKDEVIDIKSSYKLKPLLKNSDQFIVLPNQEHNGINSNVQFQNQLKQLLR